MTRLETTLDAFYVCPQTRAPLRLEGTTLRSESAQAAYPVRDGIPHFLRYGPAENEADADRLRRLNELARRDGALPALKAVYASDPGMLRYVTDAGRAAFLDLLPVDASSDVLEIGPGLGQFTVPLARRAKSVTGLEVVAGQAEFVTRRCRDEGLGNVRVAVGGDDCRLPYPAASFDLVVLNLVFEWCASRCLDEEPVAVQRRLLAEIERVLKPGGSLYLTTKNRYALKYLIGKPDEHMHKMRFGSALPRWLSRLLLRAKGLPRAPGRLHSHGALTRMLEQAGFGSVRSFWATPEMRYPTHYVPTDSASVRAARRAPDFPQGDSRSVRALMPWVPARWVRHCTPGLAFLATKELAGASTAARSSGPPA